MFPLEVSSLFQARAINTSRNSQCLIRKLGQYFKIAITQTSTLKGKKLMKRSGKKESKPPDYGRLVM